MEKKIPMRQCLGCREMKPKRELVRVVRSPEGEISLDFRGKAPGRGAYVCRDAQCLKKAIRARALERALSVQIPAEIYEAARLDGSNNTKTFLKITLPMLTPQLFMLLITITTGSFKVFDSIRIMTNGGPGTSTQVLCMFIYEFAFNRPNSLGLACAGGVMLMLILILITLLDFKSLEKKVHYQ